MSMREPAMFRRDLLKSALLGAAAIAAGRAVRPTPARAAESATPLDTLSNELDHQLFGDDGLGAANSNRADRLRPRQGPRPDVRARRRRRILRRLVLRFLPRSLRSWARHGRVARNGGGDIRRVLHRLVADFGPFPAASLAVRVLRPFSADLRSPRAALLSERQPAEGAETQRGGERRRDADLANNWPCGARR